jgi:hypothetical protein
MGNWLEAKHMRHLRLYIGNAAMEKMGVKNIRNYIKKATKDYHQAAANAYDGNP